MRILIIGINFAPEISSTAVYSTGASSWFAKRNHAVSVVTALPYYPAWRVFEGYSKYKYVSEELSDGVRVVHCPLYVPSKPTGAKRILHHVSFALSSLPLAIWKGLRQRPDLVLVVAPSLISAPVSWIAGKLAGAKTWLHVQDFEVEAAFATGLLPKSGAVARVALAFESWCLRRFDLVSSISAPSICSSKPMRPITPRRRCACKKIGPNSWPSSTSQLSIGKASAQAIRLNRPSPRSDIAPSAQRAACHAMACCT